MPFRNLNKHFLLKGDRHVSLHSYFSIRWYLYWEEMPHVLEVTCSCWFFCPWSHNLLPVTSQLVSAELIIATNKRLWLQVRDKQQEQMSSWGKCSVLMIVSLETKYRKEKLCSSQNIILYMRQQYLFSNCLFVTSI